MNIKDIENLLLSEMEAVRGGDGQTCKCQTGALLTGTVTCECNTGALIAGSIRPPCKTGQINEVG